MDEVKRASLTQLTQLDPRWIQIVMSVLPLVLMFVPGIPSQLIPIIITGIEEAQALNMSGADKKAHVIELVKIAIESINSTSQRTVINLDRTMPMIEHGIDLAISVVNLIHPRKI